MPYPHGGTLAPQRLRLVRPPSVTPPGTPLPRSVCHGADNGDSLLGCAVCLAPIRVSNLGCDRLTSNDVGEFDGPAGQLHPPMQFEPTTCRPSRRTAGFPNEPQTNHRSDAEAWGDTIGVGTICRVAATRP